MGDLPWLIGPNNIFFMRLSLETGDSSQNKLVHIKCAPFEMSFVEVVGQAMPLKAKNAIALKCTN